MFSSCDVKEDEYRTIFHKVQLSKRIRFPQHYKRFEMKTFAFINPHSQELLRHPVSMALGLRGLCAGCRQAVVY